MSTAPTSLAIDRSTWPTEPVRNEVPAAHPCLSLVDPCLSLMGHHALAEYWEAVSTDEATARKATLDKLIAASELASQTAKELSEANDKLQVTETTLGSKLEELEEMTAALKELQEELDQVQGALGRTRSKAAHSRLSLGTDKVVNEAKAVRLQFQRDLGRQLVQKQVCSHGHQDRTGCTRVTMHACAGACTHAQVADKLALSSEILRQREAEVLAAEERVHELGVVQAEVRALLEESCATVTQRLTSILSHHREELASAEVVAQKAAEGEVFVDITHPAVRRRAERLGPAAPTVGTTTSAAAAEVATEVATKEVPGVATTSAAATEVATEVATEEVAGVAPGAAPGAAPAPAEEEALASAVPEVMPTAEPAPPAPAISAGEVPAEAADLVVLPAVDEETREELQAFLGLRAKDFAHGAAGADRPSSGLDVPSLVPGSWLTSRVADIFRGVVPPPRPPPPVLSGRLAAQARAVFELIDKDGSGQLERQELMAACKSDVQVRAQVGARVGDCTRGGARRELRGLHEYMCVCTAQSSSSSSHFEETAVWACTRAYTCQGARAMHMHSCGAC